MGVSRKLEVRDGKYYLGGKEYQLISGTMHYFRTVPTAWKDRMLKMRACGLNALETYVAWNLHESKEGEFYFEGFADIERFLRTAEEVGLDVILRPGPYICAEWEFGGLPAWLLNEKNIRLRTADPVYLEKVSNFYKALIAKVRPFLSTNGGPIIACQVENEYGSFGCDKKYLEFCRDLLRELGVDVLLFTSDGGIHSMLSGGTLPDILPTVNFGSNPADNFAALDRHRQGIPHTCMEYWCGWFDHWGEKHHARSMDSSMEPIKEILDRGDHLNIYMFHGGSNFGFYNGANYSGKLQPTVTSYDYDAFLTESGDPTAKAYALREYIGEKYGLELPELPKMADTLSRNKLVLTKEARLFDNLDLLGRRSESAYPLPMEAYGQNLGLILYRTYAKERLSKAVLKIQDPHDLCLVFVDGKYMGYSYRDDNRVLELELDEAADKEKGHRFDFLVENMGRVNYGPELFDRKGITYGVILDRQFLSDFEVYSIDFAADKLESDENLAIGEKEAKLEYASVVEGASLPTLSINRVSSLYREDKGDINLNGEEAEKDIKIEVNSLHSERELEPRFYETSFNIEEAADAYISLKSFTKGLVFINGFLLGRYFNLGPQNTIYLPKELLEIGVNTLTIFDYFGASLVELGDKAYIEIEEQADLG